jgi:LPS sulfotransferase NodH
MKKFVILTTPRTGSTYIRLWLNNHPNIRCHGELFLRNYSGMDGFRHFCQVNNTRRFLHNAFCNKVTARISNNIFAEKLIGSFLESLYDNPKHSGPWVDLNTWDDYQSRQPQEIEKSVGFKLMFSHLKDYCFLKKWIQSEKIKIMFLRRNNLLKMYLSNIRMQKQGLDHSTAPIAQDKMFINPKTILSDLDRASKTFDEIRLIFPQNSYLEITYEDFFENTLNVATEIFDFLDVVDMKVSNPSLKKVNSDSTQNIIKNYDEVCRVLKDTPYGKFL